MTKRRGEMTVTERVALIAWRLKSGDAWTTAEIAGVMGLEYSAAHRRLEMMSRVIPIYQDEMKRWRCLPEDEN